MEWIKHFDEETKVELEIPQLYSKSHESIRALIESNKSVINNSVFNAIEFGILNNLDKVCCFALQDSIFNVTRDIYKEKLDLCIKYFEGTEEYEKCAQIINLLNLL